CDLDAVAGLRIAPAARELLTDPEVPEPHDLHVLTLLETAEDGREERFDDRRRLPFRETVGGHCIDQVVLGQCLHLPSAGTDSRAHRGPSLTRVEVRYHWAAPPLRKPAGPRALRSSRTAIARVRSANAPARTR